MSECSTVLSQKQRLEVDKYGWIGELALSYGRAAPDPFRSAVIGSAARIFIATMVFALQTIFVTAGTLFCVFPTRGIDTKPKVFVSNVAVIHTTAKAFEPFTEALDMVTIFFAIPTRGINTKPKVFVSNTMLVGTSTRVFEPLTMAGITKTMAFASETTVAGDC